MKGKKNERFFSFYLTSRTFKAIKSGLFHFTNHRHRISAFTRTLLRTPVTLFGYPAKENGGSVRTESLRALHTRLFGPNVNIVFNLTLKAVSDSRLWRHQVQQSQAPGAQHTSKKQRTHEQPEEENALQRSRS